MSLSSKYCTALRWNGLDKQIENRKRESERLHAQNPFITSNSAATI
jgi:hypothetical protein